MSWVIVCSLHPGCIQAVPVPCVLFIGNFKRPSRHNKIEFISLHYMLLMSVAPRISGLKASWYADFGSNDRSWLMRSDKKSELCRTSHNMILQIAVELMLMGVRAAV